MSKKFPIINRDYQLEKFTGKGAWTYIALPELVQNKQNPFAWLTVRGYIDDYELKHFKQQ